MGSVVLIPPKILQKQEEQKDSPMAFASHQGLVQDVEEGHFMLRLPSKSGFFLELFLVGCFLKLVIY